jgi:hypothetical protein
VAAFREAGSEAALVRPRVAEVGVPGIAGPLVADREVAEEVADGRWGPGRGRLRKGSTASKWIAFCESYSCLGIPSFLLLLTLIVNAILARKLLEGRVTVSGDGDVVEGVEDQGGLAGTDLIGGEAPNYFVDGVL